MCAPQKRLTLIILTFAILGSVVLALIWWDSMKIYTYFATNNSSLSIYTSKIMWAPDVLSGTQDSGARFLRFPVSYYGLTNGNPFPLPHVSYHQISVPIYLILIAYLASLLLIWLILMNRLANRDFKNAT